MKLSASQLQQFERSPLDWAMKYVEKLKGKTSPAMEKGKVFHAWIEHLVGGADKPDDSSLTEYDQGLIESQALDFVENNKEILKPSEGYWQHEVEFNLSIFPDFPPFVGFIDLLHIDEENNRYRIFDVKTTGMQIDGTFYGLEEDDLASNIQMMLYAVSQGQDKALFNGTVGHLQAITIKKFARILDFECRCIEIEFNEEMYLESMETLFEKTLALMNFKALYEELGLKGTIEHFGCIEVLAEKKVFGKTNPYWKIYNGKETIEEYKQRTGA